MKRSGELRRRVNIRLEKRNEKIHGSWVNSYISASGRSISMRVSTICSSAFFAFTILKEVCDSSDKKPHKIVELKKIPLLKMANSSVNNVRVEKRDNENWSKMRWFSFQKIDLLFDHWNPGPKFAYRDSRGQNILPVINAIKRGSAFNHHNHEKCSAIDVFLFLVQT